MEEVFKLARAYQGSDGDAWQHWIDYQTISYHRTLEGAQKKQQQLLKEEIVKCKLALTQLPKWEGELDYERRRIPELERNQVWLSESSNGDNLEETDYYVINVVTLEE